MNYVFLLSLVVATVTQSEAFQPQFQNIQASIVSIQRKSSIYNGYNHICTGTVIRERVVLTAAHCLIDSTSNAMRSKNELQLVAGLQSLLQIHPEATFYNISEIIAHEEFDISRGFNDIALVFVSQSLKTEPQFMKIPKKRVSLGTKVEVLSWGIVHKLHRKIELGSNVRLEKSTILPAAYCQQSYPGLFGPGMLCAEFHQPSTADAGSPLIAFENKLVGFVAFEMGCHELSCPGICTDVAYYATWIQSKLEQLERVAETPYEPTHIYAMHVVSIEHATPPFMVYSFQCEGTIISNSTILTAASCLMEDDDHNKLFPVNNLLVVAGAQNRFKANEALQVLKVKSIEVHEHYKHGEHQHDLAVIRLKGEIAEDSLHKQHIELPEISVNEEYPTQTTVLHWQKTNKLDCGPAQLIYKHMQIVSPAKCFKEPNRSMMPGFLCVKENRHHHYQPYLQSKEKGLDNCLMLRGSPLIYNDKLVGLLLEDTGCGELPTTSLYTNIWHYRDWIEKNSCTTCDSLGLLYIFMMCLVYII